jgi:hypothetical protein
MKWRDKFLKSIKKLKKEGYLDKKGVEALKKLLGEECSKRYCLSCAKEIVGASEIYVPEAVNPDPPPFYLELCRECGADEKVRNTFYNLSRIINNIKGG